VVLPLEHDVAAPEPDPVPASEDPPQETPQGRIHYHCDEALFLPDGTLHVVGWAVCEAGISEIEVKLNGDRVGTAELGHPRPDVGEQYGNIEAARHAGFRFTWPMPAITEGDHEVLITIRTQLGDTRADKRKVHADQPVAPPAPEPELPPPNELRFELDNPAVANGVALEPITDRLTIEGWVLARAGVSRISVEMDGQAFGDALLGLARPDVGAAFPETEAAMRSGYAFHFPARALRNGEHAVKLTVVAKNGQSLEQNFRVTVNRTDTTDEFSSIRRRISRVEAAMLADLLNGLQYQPEIRLLLLDDGDAAAVEASLESLRTQVYPHWRVIAAAEADAELRCEAAADADRPVMYGLLRAGDQFGCDALAEAALAMAMHGAELVYADDSRISSVSNEREAFFKPDFSPDLLLSTNYIGRAWFATGALMQRAGITPAGLALSGEYDAVLRCTEQTGVIHHVPKLLMHCGAEFPDADRDRAALLATAERRGFPAEVLAGCAPGIYRLRRRTPAKGKVSIIIPTCAAHGHIGNCIRGLRERTAYSHYEIVCIDNVPDSEPYWKQWVRDNADIIVDIPGAFNWSRFNNTAARATDGEYLLFLNDDTEIVNEDWLDALLEHAQRPEVGTVGALLLYPGGRIQHAGMMLGAGIGRHPFRFSPADEPGYFGLALTQRNVIAVTGACMLMRRSFFEEMNGFEEAHSVINNDLDFCLRAKQAGKYVVFTPHATLIHHELASRDKLGDVFDTRQFDSRWRQVFAAGDPFYHPLLSRHHDDYRADGEPTQAVYSGHPLFDRSEIRRILVVKLDHIGDFITALPPIRRLKSLFPEASITVLAGRAARAFIALEPAIDEYLEFEFFHARSALGEKELTEEDFAALRARLEPYRFDLAVDLRKHLTTRVVLRHTGARFLAGFDYMGQFPFLDIAVEWDGDRKLQRKRNHVVDDLLLLVEAIDTACNEDRGLIAASPAPLPLEQLPPDVQALFERPVVAVHAGAGNVTKEWSAPYFTALIDLLVAQDGVNVLLVGGPDDRPRAEDIAQNVLEPGRIASVTGALGLADLPRLLVRCVLYIGNDSGPKHIAAGVGVPTLGIHSGVVDPVEWGPMGRRAVGMRRTMNCSPCYLASADDCPRNLACLRFLEPPIVYRTARMMLGRRVEQGGALPKPSDGEAVKTAPARGRKAPVSKPATPRRQDRKRVSAAAL
jgi:ADP-heptose:LPS heptosyltransferase/GT2 family glycosyltransferase